MQIMTFPNLKSIDGYRSSQLVLQQVEGLSRLGYDGKLAHGRLVARKPT